MPNFRALKIYLYVGTITNLQIVLNTRKNLHLNQATQKNTCQNFPPQKIPELENFEPTKILRSSLSLEIRGPPPPPHTHTHTPPLGRALE